ncbi:MAG: DinB family protein [Gemmatimonadaceae bacterium]
MPTASPATAVVITPEALLQHWQGHRALTRRVIDAFPEDKLFTFSIGAMRPFSALAIEFLQMAVPTLRGVITGTWPSTDGIEARTKADLLQHWDAGTNEINVLWPSIPPQRFQEVDKAFGQWEMPIYGLLLYVIDNEIHHRGQGYVYLRALGIEPPPFYERT